MQSTTMSVNETGTLGFDYLYPLYDAFVGFLRSSSWSSLLYQVNGVVSELNFIAGFYFLFWPEYQLKSGYSVGCSLLFWFQQNVSLIFWYDVHITRLCCVRTCHRLLSARLEADGIWATKEYVMYSRQLFQLSTIGNVQGKKKTPYGINFPYRNWKDNLTHGLSLEAVGILG